MHITTILKTTHKTMIFSGFGLVLLACGNALASRAGEILEVPISEETTLATITEFSEEETDNSWILSHTDSPGSNESALKPDKAEDIVDEVAAGPKPQSSVVATASPKPVQAPANVAGTSLPDGVAASLSFVNNVRASVGKPALKLDSILNSYALSHAKTLASQCKLYHQSLSPIVGSKDANDNKITAAGENVAYSSSSLTEALNALKNSTGHYNNMIGKDHDFNRVGFGVVKSGETACKGHVYTVQVFAKS